jgi:hypothetical protein
MGSETIGKIVKGEASQETDVHVSEYHNPSVSAQQWGNIRQCHQKLAGPMAQLFTMSNFAFRLRAGNIRMEIKRVQFNELRRNAWKPASKGSEKGGDDIFAYERQCI